MTGRGGSACRNALLDAAEEVVLRLGIGALTLDAVAAEAKVSKGGLLYHFPSKDRLIEAMVTRTVERWRADYTAAIGAETPGRGRVARALLNMCMSTPEKWSQNSRRSGAVLIAAISNKAERVGPMRQVYRELFGLIRAEGGETGVGESVVLAIHGLWFEWIFGLEDMSPGRLEKLRQTLGMLVEPPRTADRAGNESMDRVAASEKRRSKGKAAEAGRRGAAARNHKRSGGT